MKRFLFFILMCVAAQIGWGQAGVTVITHGFQGTGAMDASWNDFADAVRVRAGNNATVYKNVNGIWVKQSGSESANSEIIFLFDWASLSSVGLTSSTYEGDGFLESAADNLFAMLLNPPSSLGLTTAQLLAKEKHFIGHSRGTILLLQLCHRLKRYYPNTVIEHLTLLDPHPATTFGDVNTNEAGSPNSLPCISGQATGCGFTIGCDNGNAISVNIPENVQRTEAYYRKDNAYEGIIPQNLSINWAEFDGVNVFHTV